MSEGIARAGAQRADQTFTLLEPSGSGNDVQLAVAKAQRNLFGIDLTTSSSPHVQSEIDDDRFKVGS